MKQNVGKALALVAILATSGATYLDTKNYRDELQKFSDVALPKTIGDKMATTKKEVSEIMRCGDARGDVSTLNEKWRDCMIPTLHAVRSENGAVVGVMQATSWLKNHPADDAMRAAATAAMTQGQAAYERYLPIYAAQQRVIDARRSSFVLHLVDGRDDMGSLLEFHVQALRKIESSLAATKA